MKRKIFLKGITEVYALQKAFIYPFWIEQLYDSFSSEHNVTILLCREVDMTIIYLKLLFIYPGALDEKHITVYAAE